MKNLRFILILFLFLGGGNLFALEVRDPSVPQDMQIHAATEKKTYQTGEEITYLVTIQWKNVYFDLKYRPPILPLENLSLVETVQSAETRLEGQDRVYERLIYYRLKGVKAGEASIGQYLFEYTLPDSMDVQRVQIDPVYLEIKASSPLTGKLLFEILFLLAFLSLSLVFLKRRKKRTSPQTKPLENSLEDETIYQLLKMQTTLSQTNAHDFIRLAGELFRGYLQSKFILGPQKLSLKEISDSLDRRRDIPAEDRNKIAQVLERINESTFAGIEPGVDESKELMIKISDFIAKRKIV